MVVFRRDKIVRRLLEELDFEVIFLNETMVWLPTRVVWLFLLLLQTQCQASASLECSFIFIHATGIRFAVKKSKSKGFRRKSFKAKSVLATSSWWKYALVGTNLSNTLQRPHRLQSKIQLWETHSSLLHLLRTNFHGRERVGNTEPSQFKCEVCPSLPPLPQYLFSLFCVMATPCFVWWPGHTNDKT